MIIRKKHFALLALIASFSTNAIVVDTMIKVAKGNKDNFTVSNPAADRQYINVSITRLRTKDGQFVETPYTRDNISQWDLSVRPAKTIINPNGKKSFAVEYSPKTTADSMTDNVFKVSFMPTPYSKDEDNKNHKFLISVGMAPFYIVPAKTDAPLNYEISYQDDKITLKNHGKTYIKTTLNACTDDIENKKSCSMDAHLVAGRYLTLSLPEAMQKKGVIDINMHTNHHTYTKNVTIKKGENLKS